MTRRPTVYVEWYEKKRDDEETNSLQENEQDAYEEELRKLDLVSNLSSDELVEVLVNNLQFTKEEIKTLELIREFRLDRETIRVILSFYACATERRQMN